MNSVASFGKLTFEIISSRTNRPIGDAKISISDTATPENIIEEVTTNSLGQIEPIDLPAPPLDYSLEPSTERPYSVYKLTITAEGFEPIVINGAEILPTQTAVQKASLLPVATGEANSAELFVIPDHTLYGEYPPKIAEDEIKPLDTSGEIVLSEVVIPEYVVVHDGPPTDQSANNYYVLYRDYIKNVASSEIYATWPESTLFANILAIQSFTLNRVFTEWYRN
mgnify:CR=1 FL=1